ncbi:helix-turn-helix domain-containing protein [Neisseria sp. Ec49-e6-T10]|uniref:helix-turn-helix domain-containing protein n=1 Tax=Neisseria sp. Ec49-e6-T10 TaxID=3140744 RepID=UPI003EBED012
MSDKSLAEYHLDVHKIMSLSKSGYSGITLLYVLKGSVDVGSEEMCIHLYPDDVLLINKNHQYEISSDQDNIVIRLEVSNHYFARYFKEYFHHKFTLVPDQQPGFKRKYTTAIKVLLARMLTSYIRNNIDFTALEINKFLSEILLILVLYFKEEDLSNQKLNSSYSKRIDKIIRFLEDHYNQNVSLKAVADSEHISFAYLSRLFKKEVGLSFIQYLTKIKFEHCVHDLVNTSKPVYQIIQEHGFSNTKQFIQLFKNVYNQTPNKFRESYKNHDSGQAIFTNKSNTDIVMEQMRIAEVDSMELLSLLADSINLHSSQEPLNEQYYPIEEQVIDIDLDKKPHHLSSLEYIVSVGELSEVLKQNVQQQLSMIKQEARLDYVEIHHLISGSAILPEYQTDEPIPSFSPYTNSDHAISFLKQNNIALFVRIAHKNVYSDLTSYIQKLAKFVEHNVNLFGINYVQKWRFIYYAENKEVAESVDFEKGFFILKKMIRSWLHNAKVGVFFHFSGLETMKKDVFFQSKMAQIADFLGYSANPNEQVSFTQIGSKSFADSERYIQEKTHNLKNALKYHDMNIPLYLLTWNTLTGNTRHTNGRFFRGALIFNTLISVSAQIAGIGFWINAEIQQETLPERIDTSSLALFYIYNTKRPAFHVLKFTQRLQGQIIAKGHNYLITKTYFGYQIVFTNTTAFNPYISIKEHLIKNFKKEKKFIIHGLDSGHYQVRKFIFDQQHGALYRQFELFQTKYGKDEEMVAYLKQSAPYLTVFDEYIHNPWAVLSELDINAIHFYELRKML